MKLQLRKGESAAAGLARINRELCARALEVTASSDVPTDSAVFELRKTMKKLRAILRITRPALTDKTYRKIDRLLRDLGRDLGRARDRAVQLETLDRLLAHFSPLPDETALQPVRSALHCRYQFAVDDFLQTPDAHTLGARVSHIEHQIGKLDLSDFPDALLLNGISRTYRRCREDLRTLHAAPSTDNSYALRKQVMYVWNQLRLVREWHGGRYLPLIADLDRLGGLLGQDSDLAMLVDGIRQHPEICCDRVRAEFVVALGEYRRTAVLTAGLHLADRCFARKPSAFGDWLTRGSG